MKKFISIILVILLAIIGVCAYGLTHDESKLNYYVSYVLSCFGPGEKIVVSVNKKKQESYEKTLESLSDKQIKDINSNLKMYLSLSKKSKNALYSEEDYKKDDSNLTSEDYYACQKDLDNMLSDSYMKYYRDYFSLVEMEYDKELGKTYTYSKKYNRVILLPIKVSYPNLSKLINYDYFNKCASENKYDVNISVTSPDVLKFVKENYKDNLIHTTIYAGAIVSNNGVKFYNNWLNQFEYLNDLRNKSADQVYSFKESKNTKAFSEFTKILDSLNSGNLTKVTEDLVKDREIEDNYKPLLEIILTLDENTKKQVMDELLTISKFDYKVLQIKVDDKYGDYISVITPNTNYGTGEDLIAQPLCSLYDKDELSYFKLSLVDTIGKMSYKYGDSTNTEE